MNYSQHTKQASVNCKNNKIVFQSEELKYNREAEAFAALVSSANKDEMIERAAIILTALTENDKGQGPKELIHAAEEWLELATALEDAEYDIETRVQAAIDQANNPQPF